MWIIKFASCNLFLLVGTLSLVFGGAFLFAPLAYLGLAILIPDLISSPEMNNPRESFSKFYNVLLFLCLPQLILNTFLLAWYVSPGDLFGVGVALSSLTDGEVKNFSNGLSYAYIPLLIVNFAFFYGVGGTNVAHELVHRVWSPFWTRVGRYLLVFTSDTTFAIEHVYGHHRNVATRKDPATSRRGESFYRFLLRSTTMSLVSAWKFESLRLKKQGWSSLSWKNQILRDWTLTLAVYGFFAVVGGWFGLVFFLLCSFFGKALLELINYIEHYGLIRSEKKSVEPRHSWNSNHRSSSYHLYNLPRHSHHHAQGHIPFWKLKPMNDAPTLPYGYLQMIIIALFPSQFFKIMDPLVQRWDRDYAKKDEFEEILKANQFDGRKIFSAGYVDNDSIKYSA